MRLWMATIGLLLGLSGGTAAAAEQGLASVYADRFEGRRTASGEPFAQDELTAAHRKLPFGSLVRVTNLDNGLSVVVRINDRGPHIRRRVIDLSKSAAEELAFAGVAPVEVEVLERPQ